MDLLQSSHRIHRRRPRCRPFPALALVALAALAAPAASPARAEAAGAWTGMVIDVEGNLVPGAQVALVPVSFRGVRISAVTGDDGFYTFGNVIPDGYRLRVVAPGLKMHSIDAVALAPESQVAWELQGPVNPALLPEVRYEEGLTVRFDVVLVEAEAPDADPESYRGTLDRLATLVQEGRCEEAEPRLEAHLSGFPQRARGHYLLGYCRASRGAADTGAAALEQALDLNPGMPGAALLLGQVLLQAGRAEEAATWLRAEADEGQDPRLRVEAWIALGFLHRDDGRTEPAIEAFERARALAPERPGPYAELARLYAAADLPDRVADVLEAGRELGRVDLSPLLNLVIGRLNDKRHAEATKLLERGLALAQDDPDRAMVYALLGRCQIAQHKRQEGVASLRKSLSLDADGRFAEECRRILSEIGA